MDKVDNYRFKLGNSEYSPIILGGMGVDISTSEMVLEMVRLGAIGHLSDAMIPAVCDKNFNTEFSKNKTERFRELQSETPDTPIIPTFDPEELRKAQTLYVANTVDKKRGNGAVFINCMEKVQIASPMETMNVRLTAALDAGVDGITLSAGLHNYTLRIIESHPRFRDVKIGIIVSSWRALKIFLRAAARLNRLPDYVVVEGPLAGGHLGFGYDDWMNYNLEDIFLDIYDNLRKDGLEIPVVVAGGIFDGQSALKFLQKGAAAVQVATRFSITQESGLGDDAKQAYCRAEEKDVFVSSVSPTGYPFRLLRSAPCLNSCISPQCVRLGFALDSKGDCSYKDAYESTEQSPDGNKLPVVEKICLCHHILKYHTWTCGTNVVRLKETLKQNDDGTYILPTTEEVFNDYVR